MWCWRAPETATLDLYGDGLLAIDVTGQVVQAPNGATALVTNTGLIRADGGTVQLTARAADGVVQTLVDAGGTIRANTVGDRTGTIVLNGVGGDITVAGQLDATGTAPGTAGGRIGINGSGSVAIAAGARIDASGQAGGGIVAVGTTLARAAGGPGTASKHDRRQRDRWRRARPSPRMPPPRAMAGGSPCCRSRPPAWTARSAPPAARRAAMAGSSRPPARTLYIGNAAVVDASATSPSGTPGTWLLDPLDLDVVGGEAGNNNVTLARLVLSPQLVWGRPSQPISSIGR